MNLYIIFFLFVGWANGYSLSKAWISNHHNHDHSKDVYQVVDGNKFMKFSYPKPEKPTLRDITYYHVIEKPYDGQFEDKDEHVIDGAHEQDPEGPYPGHNYHYWEGSDEDVWFDGVLDKIIEEFLHEIEHEDEQEQPKPEEPITHTPELPDVSTDLPIVVPDLPEEETEAPINPDESEVQPDVPEVIPEVTERNPEIVTELPEETEIPEHESEEPVIVPEIPEERTEDPVVEHEIQPEIPERDPELPEVTEAPVDDPEIQEPQPEIPERDPELPEVQPNVLLIDPVMYPEQPEIETEVPVADPEVPEIPAGDEGIRVEEPEIISEEPEIHLQDPEWQYVQPELPTIEPEINPDHAEPAIEEEIPAQDPEWHEEGPQVPAVDPELPAEPEIHSEESVLTSEPVDPDVTVEPEISLFSNEQKDEVVEEAREKYQNRYATAPLKRRRRNVDVPEAPTLAPLNLGRLPEYARTLISNGADTPLERNNEEEEAALKPRTLNEDKTDDKLENIELPAGTYGMNLTEGRGYFWNALWGSKGEEKTTTEVPVEEQTNPELPLNEQSTSELPAPSPYIPLEEEAESSTESPTYLPEDDTTALPIEEQTNPEELSDNIGTTELPREEISTDLPIEEQSSTELPTEDQGITDLPIEEHSTDLPIEEHSSTELTTDDQGNTEAVQIDDQSSTELPKEDQVTTELLIEDQTATAIPAEDQSTTDAVLTEHQTSTDLPKEEIGTELPIEDHFSTELPAQDERTTEALVEDDITPEVATEEKLPKEPTTILPEKNNESSLEEKLEHKIEDVMATLKPKTLEDDKVNDQENFDGHIKGRTYGMNLTEGEGYVWNDLVGNPGVFFEVGQPGEASENTGNSEDSADKTPNPTEIQPEITENPLPDDHTDAETGTQDLDDILVEIQTLRPNIDDDKGKDESNQDATKIGPYSEIPSGVTEEHIGEDVTLGDQTTAMPDIETPTEVTEKNEEKLDDNITEKSIDDVDKQTEKPNEGEEGSNDSNIAGKGESSDHKNVSENSTDKISVNIDKEGIDEKAARAIIEITKSELLQEIMKNEELWKWIGDWTSKYTELLMKHIKNMVHEEVRRQIKPLAASLKENKCNNALKDVVQNDDSEDDKIIIGGLEIPLTHNTNFYQNDEESDLNGLLRRRKDKDQDKYAVAKPEQAINENKPPITISAHTILGNAAGSDKVTNLFFFYSHEPEIVKHKDEESVKPDNIDQPITEASKCNKDSTESPDKTNEASTDMKDAVTTEIFINTTEQNIEGNHDDITTENSVSSSEPITEDSHNEASTDNIVSSTEPIKEVTIDTISSSEPNAEENLDSITTKNISTVTEPSFEENSNGIAEENIKSSSQPLATDDHVEITEEIASSTVTDNVENHETPVEGITESDLKDDNIVTKLPPNEDLGEHKSQIEEKTEENSDALTTESISTDSTTVNSNIELSSTVDGISEPI